jgi:magnesium-transporting ATPase (P-type)
MVKNKVTGEVFFHSKGSPEKMYGYLREDDRAEAERRVNELAKDGLRVLLYAAVKLDWARIEEQFTAAWATQEEDGVAIQIFMYAPLARSVSIGGHIAHLLAFMQARSSQGSVRARSDRHRRSVAAPSA